MPLHEDQEIHDIGFLAQPVAGINVDTLTADLFQVLPPSATITPNMALTEAVRALADEVRQLRVELQTERLMRELPARVRWDLGIT